MNRNAASKLTALFLLAMAWLAGSVILGAQQPSGAAGAESQPTASRMPGEYSMDGSGPDRESALAPAGQIGSKATSQTGMIGDRSTWAVGASGTGRASAAAWVAGEASFRGHGASSWVAGTGDFNLSRQQGGIWRELPRAGFQSNTSVMSAESNDLFAPSALTQKGAALIKGGGFSSSYASHLGNGSGIPRGGKPFAAQHGFGNMKSRVGSRTGGFGTGGFGGIGNGSGSKPATLETTPSTGTLNGPDIDDMLQLNEGLGPGETPGSGKLDSTGGTSH